MSKIAGSSTEVAMRGYRRRSIPVVSTIVAILLVLLPFIMTTPLIPDFGFLVLITWRLLRPELWSAQMALVLGLINDLVGSQPIGQSMALWTMVFLFLDFVDSRLVFRDYWVDWLLAGIAIIFHTAGVWYIGKVMGSDIRFTIMIPQLAFSILAYPLVARLVLVLDRWRLAR